MFTSTLFLKLVWKTHNTWKMWKNLPIIAVLFYLSDGCKTMESESFLNTFSKIWLIWKSCEYDKKELCSQKIWSLAISIRLHHLLSPKDIRKHNFSPASALLCYQKWAPADFIIILYFKKLLFYKCVYDFNFL